MSACSFFSEESPSGLNEVLLLVFATVLSWQVDTAFSVCRSFWLKSQQVNPFLSHPNNAGFMLSHTFFSSISRDNIKSYA